MFNSEFWKWLWKERRLIIVLGIIIIVLLGYYGWCTNNEEEINWRKLESWWSNLLEMPVVLGTFFITLLIWLTAAYFEWDNKLPKRITVHYKFNGKYVMSCCNAFLSGEGDIRQWAQQIGKQMAGGGNIYLDFEPGVKAELPHRSKDNKYKLYEVTFYLTNMNALSEKRNKYSIWEIKEVKNKEPLVIRKYAKDQPCIPYNPEKPDDTGTISEPVVPNDENKLKSVKEVIRLLEEKIKILAAQSKDTTDSSTRLDQYKSMVNELEIPLLDKKIDTLEKQIQIRGNDKF